MTEIKAWWFEPPSGVLGYGDGRKPGVGVTHEVDGLPVLCQYGLHASARALDALQYANTAVVWRVELGGVVVHGEDKIVATRRTYLARIDATEVLCAFARQCALDVAHLWAIPPIMREYLETGREDIRGAAWGAAWDAARSASRDAALDAALDAAWSAARDAARSAARDAAWSAARSAAWSAAWGAAWDAARDAQSDRLESMLSAALAAIHAEAEDTP